MRHQQHGERATGVFGSAWAFTIFLIFLLFIVQVLFGLYARTTTAAVAADIAQRAANEGEALTRERMAAYATEAKERLGGYGDDAAVTVTLVDVDADGTDDTVAVSVHADLPLLLPVRWSGYSPTSFTRTMRARLEVFQESNP